MKTISDHQLDKLLLAALYRRDCPDTMQLSDYQAGWLKGAERSKVESHLERCPLCRVELKRLINFLGVEPSWSQALDFEWLREAGRVVIRLLRQALEPPTPQPAAVAVRGPTIDAESPDVLRHITLGPEETGDHDIEVIVRRDTVDPTSCTLTVRVQTPGRWPELAGTHVRAWAGHWHAEEVTNEDGIAVLPNILAEQINQLVIEINN